MKRDTLITPFRLKLLVAGLLLVGAVLWLGLRPSQHERRRIEPVATSKSVETIEPETLSLPPSGSSPTADLKHYNAALKKLLLMPSPSSSEYDTERAEMRRIVQILLLVSLPLDFEDLVRRALAGHWDQITPEQRTEIVGVVRALAERNLSKQLYDQPNYDLRFTKETVTGSEATVDATLEWPYQGKMASVVMEWKLLYKRGSWLVYDVITDQQSMLENYRAEFHKIITKKSFNVLLERMKKHLKKIQ
jgi:ABC-type transporter MlaC component